MATQESRSKKALKTVLTIEERLARIEDKLDQALAGNAGPAATDHLTPADASAMNQALRGEPAASRASKGK